jgi:cobaltochelatase CobN
MHRLAAIPGGWTPEGEGVIIIEQTPAPIIFLTAADTDIQTLAASLHHLPPEFPSLRVVNLLHLQQELSIDTYTACVLVHAQVIILRLLGGRAYWSYGLEVCKEIVETTGGSLFILPGDDRPDPDLISHSNISLYAVNQLWHYLTEGGIRNFVNGLKFVADVCFKTNYSPQPPQSIPRLSLYAYPDLELQNNNHAKVGIIFYRAHYLSGNNKPIDALCQALRQRNLTPIPVFVSSLRDEEVQTELLSLWQSSPVDLILNTTSFSIAKIGSESQAGLWQKLAVPVFQVILSGSTQEYWQNNFQGLTPPDVAMNVALPEVDGRIITRAISFKSVANWNEALETEVIVYQPLQDRVDFVADLATNWVRLKHTPPRERKIAVILANYPNKDGRIANGVGLDTPASCLNILRALQAAGYFVENIPQDGDELIWRLTEGITNDLAMPSMRQVNQDLSLEDYQEYFTSLPAEIKSAINQRWGRIFEQQQDIIPIPGIQLGNIFVGIQPSRGYDLEPSLNYHAPDLEPTPHYLAYYYWLKEKFKASAIIHLGKHGNLEWLPGKSLVLSANCYPEITNGTLPHFYPFIVNDPGEGSQAKRRANAVILDHLTPPLTRAELYGNLLQLEALIDEYYQAQSLNPSRLKLIGDRIRKLVREANLHQDLGLDDVDGDSLAQFLTVADGYLCELKEAQIRDGLHIFGQCPPGKQLRDLIIAIARFSSYNRRGLIEAIAEDLGLDFNPLTANPTQRWGEGELTGVGFLQTGGDKTKRTRWESRQGGREGKYLWQDCRNLGDIREVLEELAADLVEQILANKPIGDLARGKATAKQIKWIKNNLLPCLQKTDQEIANLLRGLDGKYIPSGAAGAPTRGRPDVLPTGRNFYSVDIRGIPTETAWDVGRKAAEAVIERYTQENGEYPQTMAISVWGTSTMRTGGDDIAQIFALLGVQPVWEGVSRRVVGFEILSQSVLGRPRVDVTVRVSGFFRDAFPNILEQLYKVIASVSSLEEEKELNPLATQVQIETEFWRDQGLTKEQAEVRARHRIFGSKPGAYGAGLQGLIESQNWYSDEDLARAYINWSSYAYMGTKSVSVPEAFEQRLKQLQIVLHNQDNREHDLLDSDDYYQFQGGLTAAIRSLTGKNPQIYFGDNSLPNQPKVRKLKEEIARVYRSRVVNPKWIGGVMRHGYKGAFEMAATVDYLFAYDATTKCVEDYMYQGVAEAYLFDSKVQQFIQQKNPWALRDMAERLIEASRRGLWQNVSEEMIDKLRAIAHQAEGLIE